jgi:bifunctional NMN adenylyltransferase/nudix hydrolase
MQNTRSIGVIIARFQTPSLHEGHLALIHEVQQHHNKVVIVLGVAPVKGSRKNPLDYYTRERMIKQAFSNIIILPLSDQKSDKEWSDMLDELLKTTFPQETFLLYGSRDSFIESYSGKYLTASLPPVQDYNATALREAISDRVLDTEAFRAGIIYNTYSLYPSAFPTVDIAVFRNDNQELLVGKKPKELAWRLPGGFADPTDENFEEAANRELKEECGDITVAPMQYLASLRVDDWRYRSEANKIITTLFYTNLIAGTPTPNDDLTALKWITVKDIPELIEKGEIIDTHIPLLRKLVEKIAYQD